jgi:hypothetical protein
MTPSPQYTDDDIDEDMKLTRSDYIKILQHYHRGSWTATGISTKTVKERAHRIFAEKLCRCIKPPTTTTRARKRRAYADESRRIAYCTRSIFNNKNLRRPGFRCKSARGNRSRPRFTSDITKSGNDVVLRH